MPSRRIPGVGAFQFFNGQQVQFVEVLFAGSPYAVLPTSYALGGDTTGGVVNFDLEAAATAGAGRVIIVVDSGGNCGVNAITVTPNLLELIDGVNAAVNITVAYGSLRLICDGAEWYTF